jgi:aminomethyltransferase
MPKRTQLFATHQKLGGRLVEFGGWEMPVRYTGIVDEHLAVRSAAGLFDISHMGEIIVTGPGALDFLNATLTNDLRKCPVGRGQYTFLCNEQGGVIDDLYVYLTEALSFLLIVNASRIAVDYAWLEQQLALFHSPNQVRLSDASESSGALALQGPRTVEFIDRCLDGPATTGAAASNPTALRKNELAAFSFGRDSVWVSRTGYTGEDGFEIVAPAELIELLWDRLMEAGQPFGLKPCGLGARDTLRTEVCYPLYGHELDESTTPLEAGLGAFVALGKGGFVGQPVLAEQKAQGVRKRCIAFTMTGKSAPPRPGYAITSASAGAGPIGTVTSGTQSPSLGIGIGLGYVPPEFAEPGTPIRIEIRGKQVPAAVVAKPIYRKAV